MRNTLTATVVVNWHNIPSTLIDPANRAGFGKMGEQTAHAGVIAW
jgi:hypothetical protein